MPIVLGWEGGNADKLLHVNPLVSRVLFEALLSLFFLGLQLFCNQRAFSERCLWSFRQNRGQILLTGYLLLLAGFLLKRSRPWTWQHGQLVKPRTSTNGKPFRKARAKLLEKYSEESTTTDVFPICENTVCCWDVNSVLIRVVQKKLPITVRDVLSFLTTNISKWDC